MMSSETIKDGIFILSLIFVGMWISKLIFVDAIGRLNKVNLLIDRLINLIHTANVRQTMLNGGDIIYDFNLMAKKGVKKLFWEILMDHKSVKYENYFDIEVINKARRTCLCKTLEDLKKLELETLYVEE